MMLRARTFPIPLWLALCAQPTLAALSLPEVAASAVAQSPEVRIKMHQYLGAEADYRAARARFFPEVDLGHTSGRTVSDADAYGNTFRRTADSRAWSLSMTQSLFHGFQTLYETRRQDHAKSAQYFQLLDVSQQQALEAARAFLDVSRHRALLVAARQSHDSHQRIYQKIHSKARPQNGVAVAAGVDLEQAAGRLALADANMLTAEANLADVSARYARLVGTAPPGDLARFTPPSPLPARAMTVDATPAVLATRAAVSAARQQVQARRGAFLPRLDARARQEWGSMPSGGLGVGAPVRVRQTVELIGVLNLSRGGADKARLARAAEELNAARAQQDKVCREARQQWVMAQNEWEKLQRKIGFLQQHALASEKVRDAYWAQFEISRRTLLDVLDSENEFFRSRSALIDGEADLALAGLRTQAASGTLLDALGIAPALPAPAVAQADAEDAPCVARDGAVDNHG